LGGSYPETVFGIRQEEYQVFASKEQAEQFFEAFKSSVVRANYCEPKGANGDSDGVKSVLLADLSIVSGLFTRYGESC
jgi:hypothetical protein